MHFALVNKHMLKMSHADEQPLTFGVREFSSGTLGNMKDGSDNPIDPFKEINGFMKTLPRSKQDTLYQAYNVVMEELAVGAVDIDIINKVARSSFKTIYDIISIDAIEEYLIKNKLYHIPDQVEKDYTGEHAQNRTYTVPKYIQLLALAVGGRMAIPIWGEIAALRKNSIGTKRTPIQLLKLLDKSAIIDTIQFKTLEEYSNATIDAGTFDAGKVVAGYGTEYNVSINLASNFVKRVAVANLTRNIATSVFNYIANDGAYNDASSGETVWGKKKHKDEEKSNHEMYDMREKMSQGDITMVEHYFSDPVRVIEAVFKKEPLSDEDLKIHVERSVGLFEHLQSVKFTPTTVNLRLCQWLLGHITPPKTLTFVGLETQRIVVSITAIILWHMGFTNLAALPISEVTVSQNGHSMSFRPSRKQIHEYIEIELKQLYPLTRNTKERDGSNMAKNAINRYYVEVNNSTMKIEADKRTMRLFTDAGILNRHQRFTPQPETPIDLCNFIIALNKMI